MHETIPDSSDSRESMPDATRDPVRMFNGVMCDLVRGDRGDLTHRQTAVFLTCQLAPEAQTVRGLASLLHVSRPAITRALDRLSELGLLVRREDPSDRRSILVGRTEAGGALMDEMAEISARSAARAGLGIPSRARSVPSRRPASKAAKTAAAR